MKITLQTLKGTKYEIEVKEADLVQDVKQRCETEFDLGDAVTMKLIHAGKILKDKDTIEASKVKNGDFLVVMVPPKKPGAPAAKKPTSPTPVPTSGASQAATTSTTAPSSPTPAVTTSQTTGATTSGTAPSTTTTQPTGTTTAPGSGTSASTSGSQAGTTTTQAATKPSGPGSAQTQASSNTLVMGADYEAMVANLMGLGFSHEKVVQALRASFNNPDRAAEYLFNGIPESVLAQLNAQGGAGAGASGAGRGQAQAGQSQSGQSQTGAGRGSQAQGAGSPSLGAMLGASGAGNPLAALNSPEFAQLRQMIQANPSILPLLLQQLQQSNPQLFQMIGSNPAAMAQMMQALGVGGAGQGGSGSGSGSGDVSGASGSTSPSSQGQSGASRGGQVIQVTQEEKAALDRLEALGFPKQKALEAFLLCERNEELAANYLFDHAHDEVGGAGAGDDAGAD